MSTGEQVREVSVGVCVGAGRTLGDHGVRPPSPHYTDELTEAHGRQGFAQLLQPGQHSAGGSGRALGSSSVGSWDYSLEARLTLL